MHVSGSLDASEWGGICVPSKQWSESRHTQGKGRGTRTHKKTQVEQGRRKGVREKAVVYQVNVIVTVVCVEVHDGGRRPK